MALNRYAKGRRFEHKIIHELELKGWFCMRSAGSKGAIDIIAFKGEDRLFIQAKNDDKVLSLTEWNTVYALAHAHASIPIYARNVKGKTQYLAIMEPAKSRQVRKSTLFFP